MMTGKELKQVVSLIPDDALVDIGMNEDKELSYYPPEIISGATVQTKVTFSEKTAEATVIFDIDKRKDI